MTGRSVDHGIRLLAAIALLAMVSSALRPTAEQNSSPRSNCPARHFAHLKSRQGGRVTIPVHSYLREAYPRLSDFEDELEADIEDEVTLASLPASEFFVELLTPSPEPYLELNSFAVTLAVRPLRC